MIRSMTGYGAATVEAEGGTVTVELRSVNSRHLKVTFRLPDGAEAWEPELRSLLGDAVRRGHLTVRVVPEPTGGVAGEWELDSARLDGILEAVETLRREYNLPGRPDLPLVASFGDLLRPRRTEPVAWLEVGTVERATERALEALVEMREREGTRLEEDLRERVGAIRRGAAAVEEVLPERLERARERLLAAARELTDGLDGDEDRVAREVALLADKWDVGEELVRTRSHLDAFEEYLEARAGEPVGKRLAFLVQELHREINTMGAKANDTGITRHVVEMKNEVERLREQVENVE